MHTRRLSRGVLLTLLLAALAVFLFAQWSHGPPAGATFTFPPDIGSNLEPGFEPLESSLESSLKSNLEPDVQPDVQPHAQIDVQPDVQTDVQPDVQPNVEAPVDHEALIDSQDERFLAFLPHSGMHNQRLALENAMFLAWATQRTLIVPPIIFGGHVPHMKFRELSRKLEGMPATNKKPLPDCSVYRDGAQLVKCQRRYQSLKYTLVPWEELVDLSFARKHLQMVPRKDFNPKTLAAIAGVQDVSADSNDPDVYIVTETQMYSFQVYDTLPEHPPPSKFRGRIRLSDLQRRTEKLMLFNSLFSSSRLLLNEQSNKAFYRQLQNSMIFNHPELIKAVDRIIEDLGGAGTYVGMHLRTGDGFFKKSLRHTISNVTHLLSHEYDGGRQTTNTVMTKRSAETDDDAGQRPHPALGRTGVVSIDSEERQGDDDGISSTDDQATSQPSRRALTTGLGQECRRNSYNSSLPVLYIATDATSDEPALQPVYEALPCVYRLTSFEHHLDGLSGLVNPLDDAGLYEYFVPLVDLLVVSRGSRFIGIKRSTFSGYALRLHYMQMGKDDSIMINGPTGGIKTELS